MKVTLLCAVTAGLFVWLASGATPAEVKLPGDGAPLPTFRDAAGQTSRAAGRPAVDPDRSRMRDIGPLKTGLEALRRGDIGAARGAREALAQGSLDHQAMSWAIALSGADAVSSEEIHTAMRTLRGWPGIEALERHAERALLAEGATGDAVVAAFAGRQPRSVEGITILARAQLALGDDAAAAATLRPLWREERLEAGQEAAILREFGAIIPAADHRARMEQMLHFDRVNAALRVADRAGAGNLAQAWGAVIRRERRAGKLLDQVPQAQRGAAYAFARARHLRWAGKYREAAAVMLAAPRDAAALADPDAWWVERRVLSRELLDLGDAETAYAIAAGHAAESKSMIADAEFHAGWYALRGVGDAARAAGHFRRIAEIADGPISLARAHYWLGRAMEAGAPGDAETHYRQAARYGTTFYGQLAAARVGLSAPPIAYPAPSEAERREFADRLGVRAIRRIESAGFPDLADRLYRSLAEELPNAGELALLAVMAENRGDHFLALRIGKIAASRGIEVGALAHPVGVIPASADISGAGQALAYAVARQESEFNVSAVSPAGARGLLQLLPRTARSMARRAGLNYSAEKLTSDAAYNATLGATFLHDQLGRFDGSYVLTFAGYNAGPARAESWIKRYGDPRGEDIETVVDWIERIPYTETRNYVQRVMENLQVYKMRLSGRIDIIHDLSKGR